ncbi:MAG: hypothetical protein RLZZ347_460 [Candidatus Parcubacteria bacterium]|jgi:glycosyltransferase involved in cell wall biosynthesis
MNKHIKICFVSTNIDPSNGSGRFASSMIRNLETHFGVQSIVLIERGEQELLQNTKAVLFKNNLCKFLVNPIIIAWYARKASVVHVFDGWPLLPMVYFSSFLSRRPYTCSLYATYAVRPLYHPIKKYIARLMYAKSSLNASISNITASKLRQAWSGINTQVILQGIQYSAYQSNILPRKIPSTYVLTVATIKRRKGYLQSIQTFEILAKKFPQLVYVIVGRKDDSAYCQSVIAEIARLNLGNRIVWLENQTEAELISLYTYAEVFFLPSLSIDSRDYFEGFGSVYLEAEACGTPVVTSRGGGQEDALVDGETGILVTEGDIQGYAQALSLFLADPVTRKTFATRARQFAQKMDWSNRLVEYYSCYEKII